MLYGMVLVYFGWHTGVDKPIFVPRLLAVDAGKAHSLITAADRKVALGFAVGTIAAVAMSMASTNEKFLLNSSASWFVTWYQIN